MGWIISVALYLLVPHRAHDSLLAVLLFLMVLMAETWVGDTQPDDCLGQMISQGPSGLLDG